MDSRWKTACGIAVALLLTGAGCPFFSKESPGETAMENAPGANVVEATYSIRVDDQTLSNGSVVIAEVKGIEATWVAIHREEGGKPGAVIGHGLVAGGTQKNISIDIDAAKATPELFAMLHEDAGEEGFYEFPGPDAPITVNGNIVMTKFSVVIKTASPAPNPPAQPPAQVPPPPAPAPNPPPVVVEERISLTAKRWEFSPSTIRVKKGSRVVLAIQSLDVTHGFSIPEFNVNAALKANETTVVAFTADKTGTFSFSCNVFCGSGHANMTGTLIVE